MDNLDIYEVSGYKTGLDRSGVNFLDPIDAFETLRNGFVYRQELKSRKGFAQFANRLDDGTRVMGIFENVLPDSTRQLLIISKEFLYAYNAGTDTFDQVPMAGLAPIAGFGISGDDDYVSGTTYLTKDGEQRFVFTGKGMDAIYFYDGTDVKVFNNVADNPDYENPIEGTLVRATHIIWFGERLNLFVPVITGATTVTYNQGILYSAIRTASGNGDKFNQPGAGLLQADTYELMKGAIILGDVIILKFQRSDWTLEKTRDAFNPYFVRKIPSVLGTDAGFSSVSWNYEAKSAGITGLITTDGRQSLRFDNLLPNFTADNIQATTFELTYGGFDRINEQFLFSYLSGDTDTTTQDKVLVYNYAFSTFSINDQRFSVFGQTVDGQSLVWQDIDETHDPSWERWDTTEQIWNKIGLGSAVNKTLAGDNQGFVYWINQDFDDYFVSISAITQASSAVVTVDPCALQVGDEVVFENVEGMTEINGQIGTILSIGTTSGATTSITVNINSTNFTAYTGEGSVSKVIDFEATMTVFNPYRGEGRRVYVSHLEFLINRDSPELTVEVFADEEETPFVTSRLLVTTPRKAREWITMTVNQEANFMTFDLKSKAFANQLIISSIRIHASKGGLTSG